MIRPSPRLLALVLLGLIAAAMPVLLASYWWWFVVVYDFALLGLFGYDAITAARANELSIQIQTPSQAYLGNPIAVGATIRFSSARPQNALVRIETEGPIEPLTTATAEPIDQTQSVSWQCRPTNRGVILFNGASVQWTGPLGLSVRSTDFAIERTLTVVPNIGSVKRAAIRLSTHHTFLSGLKTRRFVGDGSEFESLRKYQPGLDRRLIDWKASAKHHKLLCRENRSERNHRVILAFDTGRLMGEPVDGLPKLDHTINAGLLLAYLSLRMGDRVGILGFDSEVHAYISPQPGIRTFQRLSSAAAELPYSQAEANYTLALTELSTRLRRRSIVIVLTDFTDTVTAELMIENIDRLSRRHLVIFVAVREPDLDDLVDASPKNVMDINRATVAQEMMVEREQVITRLRLNGIFCIDCQPRELSVELINRYLDIQRRELL